MPTAYVGDVDSALVNFLMSDNGPGGLMKLMPDGIFFDVAASSATQYVLIKVQASENERVFGGVGIERPLYLVKAVARNTSGASTHDAAARIDLLLNGDRGQGGSFPGPTGFARCASSRVEYIRYAEIDTEDPDARWQHRGGLYDVHASPLRST